MRLTALLSWAVALTSSHEASVGSPGFALGNLRPNGTCKTQPDFDADFAALARFSQARLIRTYSVCGNATPVLQAARDAGFRVVLGAWPDHGQWEAQRTALAGLDRELYRDTLVGITVGSEGILRGSYSVGELQGWISDTQSMFPEVAVGTADVWDSWRNGAMDLVLRHGVRLILINAFTYWDGVAVGESSQMLQSHLNESLTHIHEQIPDGSNTRIMIGETGWPGQGGTDNERAVASTTNAQQFWTETFCGLVARGWDTFWFEAFDEPAKGIEKGKNAGHWGALRTDREPKFSLICS